MSAATRTSAHSTAGLIEVLSSELSEHSREWLYYGATVQDLSDTWTAVLMRRFAAIALRDLREIEGLLLELAEQNRGTAMLGRTHGQPGAPITFGYKAVVWATEVRRHIERLKEMHDRITVVQLGGAVGTGAVFGHHVTELQEKFASRLGLGVPELPWLSARDRIAEFVTWLAMVTGTLGKVGREITNLQRPEIDELRQPDLGNGVGSITMPHKRNPAASEQLVTLARVARSSAGLALEGLVHEHERDGAAWKAEWLFIPEAMMVTAASMSLGKRVVAGLEVRSEQMARNLSQQRGYVFSEQAMRVLGLRIGHHTARDLVGSVARSGVDAGVSFEEALLRVRPETGLTEEEIAKVLTPEVAVPNAATFTDRAAALCRQAREQDPEWSS
jgi:adenylosuccinate lyase